MWYAFLIFMVVGSIAMIAMFIIGGVSLTREAFSLPLRPTLNKYAQYLANSYNSYFEAGRIIEWTPYIDEGTNLWWTGWLASLPNRDRKIAVTYAGYLYDHFNDAQRRNMGINTYGKPFKDIFGR
jgi:hypothetical protein